MHNPLGRMSTLDDNQVIFPNHHCNCGCDQPADTVYHVGLTLGIRSAERHLAHEPLRVAVATILEKTGWPYVALEKTHGCLT